MRSSSGSTFQEAIASQAKHKKTSKKKSNTSHFGSHCAKRVEGERRGKNQKALISLKSSTEKKSKDQSERAFKGDRDEKVSSATYHN